MKRLWKMIPPCFSDVLGFEAVVNDTSGLGIVDDSSRYKPLKMNGNKEFRRPNDELHGKPEGGGGRPDGFGGRPEGFGGRPGGFRGKPGGFGRRGMSGVRVVNSDIRNAEIIHGTQQKVLDAFENNAAQYEPDFVLLAYAPSSSMIGSDLDTAAESIGGRSGLPTASVNLHGDKDYLYGVSYTLEAMGKLLLTKQDTVPNTVNLLGCNTLDWANETLSAVEEMLTNAGYTVLSRWGMKDTTENLKKASAASVNLVVTAAGFRLARYMEAEYGIPYVVGAPFGADQWAALLDELRGAPACGERPGCEAPEVLVIGEQLTADAIRQALLRRGYGNIQVLSFYDMEKSVMLTGDQKLSSEDDLVKKLQQPSIKLVIGDPDCKAAASRDIPWIDLPNGASMSPVNSIPNFNMAGEALDRWLDGALQNRSKV